MGNLNECGVQEMKNIEGGGIWALLFFTIKTEAIVAFKMR